MCSQPNYHVPVGALLPRCFRSVWVSRAPFWCLTCSTSLLELIDMCGSAPNTGKCTNLSNRKKIVISLGIQCRHVLATFLECHDLLEVHRTITTCSYRLVTWTGCVCVQRLHNALPWYSLHALVCNILHAILHSFNTPSYTFVSTDTTHIWHHAQAATQTS